MLALSCLCFFFSSRRRHTRFKCDWSSDVCSSDLSCAALAAQDHALEDLDPGPGALRDLDVNPQRVARPEFRDVRSDLCLLQLGNRGVHRCGSSVVITRTPANALNRSLWGPGAMRPAA